MSSETWIFLLQFLVEWYIFTCNDNGKTEVSQLTEERSAYDIGKRLANLRAMLGMTQAEVAAGTGTKTEKPMDAGVISRYESGTTIPGWRAIERVLAAMGRTPADLFRDLDTSETSGDTFKLDYYTASDAEKSTEVYYLRKQSPAVTVLGMKPIDHRYAIALTSTEQMYPTWAPGDMLIIDQKLKPAIDRIVIGLCDGLVAAGRVVERGDLKYLVPDNPAFPAHECSDVNYDHRGVVIHVIRNVLDRYVSSNPELRAP